MLAAIIWAGIWSGLGFSTDMPLLLPDGIYAQDCLHRRHKVHRIMGDQIFSQETNFYDDECTQPQIRIEMEGSYQLNGSGHLDFTFEDVFYIPWEKVVADLYSHHQVCGIDAWKEGQRHSIQGLSCDFFQSGYFFLIPAKSDKRFGLVKVEKNQIWMGRLSLDRDATNPFRRPLVFDPNPFRKLEIP